MPETVVMYCNYEPLLYGVNAPFQLVGVQIALCPVCTDCEHLRFH